MTTPTDALELKACVWKRDPDGEGEWVLELEGIANGCSFVSRHTEPLSVSLEDVAGLPSLYALIEQLTAEIARLRGALNDARPYIANTMVCQDDLAVLNGIDAALAAQPKEGMVDE